ncbi:cytochrome P450, putative [Ixodes scapularis]|uniref:Cytochrome P450, putative n=1 Tax=Ixodes scapularis TaxID=6945 RepID=B7QLU8_IXOSC|nr:cytochrome P450, putative [Ixodes scapularis]|eukprot:XP_002416153.1 cytochrome P450, putative [Ixodes scapularis]
MTTLNGKRWSDNRKFALHMLRDAGLGKKAAEEHVMSVYWLLSSRATEDTHIRGFSIPKGTVVIANLWAVHMDPKLWTKPDEFDPTRFMDEEGRGILAKPEYLIPFSIGKRMCPGETLATVEIFVYLTSLLQKFRVLPEEGQNVCLDTETTSFNIPRPQKLRFLPRH